ncbi:histidine triad (HIT) family protein [Desulfuromusa kysingii]|uniref:Histidine triad (HIT) family protein n=1 Tax=Desulfuromusa kysingii TaxID=37625 RepID=A0A1H4D5R9_9BACT|nr:histidine triad nucleotide-binding protein [Desulfuromusa kysingii]SEA67830.1 histidine triad (HIT) family protein [Desulfuromusa kysingii]
MSTDCLFCKIIAGEIPATVIYEDTLLLVFRDINPQAPHHFLIVPKKHIATTLDLTAEDNELVGHVYQIAGKIARDSGFAADGFRVVNNCNDAGGQTVGHIHFHLLGGRNMTWPPG